MDSHTAGSTRGECSLSPVRKRTSGSPGQVSPRGGEQTDHRGARPPRAPARRTTCTLTSTQATGEGHMDSGRPTSLSLDTLQHNNSQNQCFASLTQTIKTKGKNIHEGV